MITNIRINHYFYLLDVATFTYLLPMHGQLYPIITVSFLIIIHVFANLFKIAKISSPIIKVTPIIYLINKRVSVFCIGPKICPVTVYINDIKLLCISFFIIIDYRFCYFKLYKRKQKPKRNYTVLIKSIYFVHFYRYLMQKMKYWQVDVVFHTWKWIELTGEKKLVFGLHFRNFVTKCHFGLRWKTEIIAERNNNLSWTNLI